MVNVLPVPALASSTVTPVGSGPQTSNALGHRVLRPAPSRAAPSHSCRARAVEPGARRPARRTSAPRRTRAGARAPGPRAGSSTRTPTPLGAAVPPRGVGGRGPARERQRLAHAVVEQGSASAARCSSATLRGHPRQADDRHGRAARRRRRPRGPTVAASNSRSGCAAVSARKRTQVDEPVPRVHARVGDAAQQRAVDVRDRAVQPPAVGERDPHVHRPGGGAVGSSSPACRTICSTVGERAWRAPARRARRAEARRGRAPPRPPRRRVAPARRASSIRWPTCQDSRLSSSIGRASATSSA